MIGIGLFRIGTDQVKRTGLFQSLGKQEGGAVLRWDGTKPMVDG